MTSKDPDIIASEKALRRAARRALEIGLKTGTPVYVIKRGKIVDIAEEYRNKTRQNWDPHSRSHQIGISGQLS